MTYRVSIPSIQKSYIVNNLRIGLTGALALLNRETGKKNIIAGYSDKYVADGINESGCVSLYTQDKDMILIEQVQEVSA